MSLCGWAWFVLPCLRSNLCARSGADLQDLGLGWVPPGHGGQGVLVGAGKSGRSPDSLFLFQLDTECTEDVIDVHIATNRQNKQKWSRGAANQQFNLPASPFTMPTPRRRVLPRLSRDQDHNDTRSISGGSGGGTKWRGGGWSGVRGLWHVTCL